MTTDRIDAAISAAGDEPAASPRMRQLQVRFGSTGRPAGLLLPVDATEGEIADLAGFLLTQIVGGIRAERAAAKPVSPSRLVIARGSIPRA